MFLSATRSTALGIALAASAWTSPAAAQALDPKAHILDLVPTILDLSATVQDMAGDARPISSKAQQTLGRSGEIAIREAGDQVILSVASDVLFEFDSAALSPAAQRSLRDLAEVFSRAPEGQVLVVGHTDSKGTDDYNLALSKQRAEAVAGFLRDLGLADSRLRIEGRGEAEPVAGNEIDGRDNPEGRALNRRVEFVVPRAMLED